MEAIEQLLKLDIVQWVYTGFIIMSAIIALVTLVAKFCDTINRPIKWFKSKSKDHDLIIKTIENLDALQKKHDEDVAQSIRHDKLIKDELANFITEIKESVSASHDGLKEFAQNRINDRKQSLSIQKELTDSICALTKSDVERKEQIESLILGTRESLADRINQKYKYYLSIDGIPEDEVDEFASLHAAYKAVGGNHSGDAKYEYCRDNLRIIPVETKLRI